MKKITGKERIYFLRDPLGQWDPKTSGRSCGTFSTPASTKAKAYAFFRFRLDGVDIWLYIQAEKSPLSPLYFAKETRSGAAQRLDCPDP